MLILDDPSTWPDHIVEQLNAEEVIRLCKAQDFMDRIADAPPILRFFAEIEEHAKAHGLAGYHCTKQAPGKSIASTGLRTLDVALHHSDFRALIRGLHLVDDETYGHIDAKLTEWQANHTGHREGLLWFCLTRSLVLDSGAKRFFRYYGGEAIYFAFLRDERVAQILESLGSPVVVETRLDLADLRVFRRWAYGRTVVSHFALAHNENFLVEQLEGSVSSEVSSDRIVAVHPYREFTQKLARG